MELIGRAKMTPQFDPCSNSMQSQMELCELGSNLDLKKKKKKKKNFRDAGSLLVCSRCVLKHYL